MIKRSFLGIREPVLKYDQLGASPPKPESISVSNQVSLILEVPFENKNETLITVGDKVITGKKITLYDGDENYVISPVTGTITSILPYSGNFGQKGTSICIDTSTNEEIDKHFEEYKNASSIQSADDFLQCIPGMPPLKLLLQSTIQAKTVVICGADLDLLSTTRQYAVTSMIDSIIKGISVLTKISGGSKIVLALPETMSMPGKFPNVKTISISSKHPAALPHMITKQHFNTIIPEDKTCEEMGFFFFSAESVAAIGDAYTNGQIPLSKIVTVVNKNGNKEMISAKIGTPIGEIFKGLKIFANEKDKIIINGPMTGYCAYTLEQPIMPDTDSIIIQDRDKVISSSDYACTNCGKCIRICPANVPVNLLVRFLEANELEEAADQYDLHSCIECGLCSYVCISKIPIFQYIKIAKFELALMDSENAMEEENND